MKKILILIICSIVACFHKLSADNVSESMARSIANQFLSSLTSDNKQTCNELKLSSYQTRAAVDVQNFYLFKGADNVGFVIVAADDIVRPIIAYSTDCILSESDELPPNMEDYLLCLNEQITTAKAKGITQSEEVRTMWNTAMASANPVVLMKTANWNQYAPFYNECPLLHGNRTLTGCVPTATGILMRYYSYPNYGTGKTTAYQTKTFKINVGSRNLNHKIAWENMPLDYSNFSSEQAACVSELLADIGAASESDYGPNETPTGNNKPFEVLAKYYGYICNEFVYRIGIPDSVWHKKLKDCLNKEHPIIYSGAREDFTSGHCFIIDGYDTIGLYHINWGWGGKYNAFFALDVLRVDNNDFSFNQSALLDCFPATMNSEKYFCYNNLYYPTLNSAVLAARGRENQTIIVENNCEETNSIYVYPDNSITLDLNGKELRCTSINNNGSLTITDESKTGKIISSMAIRNNAEMRINDGMFENRIDVSEGGSLSISGGIFSQKPDEIYLADNCIITANEDPETMDEFPYRVINPTGIGNIILMGNEPKEYYDYYGRKLNGIPGKGLYLIRDHNNWGRKIYR